MKFFNRLSTFFPALIVASTLGFFATPNIFANVDLALSW